MPFGSLAPRSIHRNVDLSASGSRDWVCRPENLSTLAVLARRNDSDDSSVYRPSLREHGHAVDNERKKELQRDVIADL
jgi:hypothetical protein